MELAEKIKQEFNVKISQNQIYASNQHDLLTLREKLKINLKMKEAAVRLQNWWRNNRPSKNKFPKFNIYELKIRLEKIAKIQKWWKRMLAKKSRKIEIKRRNDAAKCIQTKLRQTFEKKK